ncbi:sphingosine N-acyltransferase lac1 [Cordyceps fumosorosea ARSEF 2679]|uniref:Sphingosine N-acyltransferase lac1 n=1 Tax=Cordyceps fumosorosea (strain ARSEF 2679) TaxID=1081104 RepID=A0A167MYK0_CORFA|nr:sphingosine N-acyltransferase lac1 [Cordyceps fumosorosea ARSEF 2679]OAA54909.1 sphingosine N-acyltransferase lac1 [Cordyceps fumosorosea ARSEF 2679]
MEKTPSTPVEDRPATTKPAHPTIKTGSNVPNMNGPLYMQTSGSSAVLVRRLKRKDEGTWKQLSRWFVENQIGLSFNLLALLFLAHAFIPKAREHTNKFFHLSYFNPATGNYAIGADDVHLIIFFIVLFTGLRASCMEYMLAPLGRSRGITKRKDLTRFTEQGWLFVYYSVFWTMGAYIYYQSPYWLNMRELWTNWPDREMDGLMKGYVLAQWAFWLQQIIVINIEDRRKDHWQMFSHHIITTLLISSCYCYHFTRVGNLILVIMDVVDLFLPAAKCLKYSGFTTACDYAFGLFMVSWFVARHVFYMMVCWSVYAHLPVGVTHGCYSGTKANLIGPYDPPEGLGYLLEPYYNSSGKVCFNRIVQWAFLAPLLALQVITIVWFTMIVRVAMKVLRGDGAEDSRSDDEEEEEEEEIEEFIYEQALEEDVGVEALDFKSWERRSGIRRQANSSGVSLPGHSDRKELLGRIGCDKQVE